MRFCTTCGRNFENSVTECPHDGTPLFDMHGSAEDEGEELQADGGASLGVADSEEAASPAVAGEGAFTEIGEEVHESGDDEAPEVENFAEVDDFSAADDAQDFSDDSQADDAVFEEPTLAEPSSDAFDAFDELPDEDSHADEDDVDLAAELFEDDDDALEVRDADAAPSSERIAAGIEDALGEFGEDEGLSAASEPVDTAFVSEEDDEPDQVIPSGGSDKKGGGGGLLVLLLVLVAGAGAGWYFTMGPGAAPATTGAEPGSATEAKAPEAQPTPTAASPEAAQDENQKPGVDGEQPTTGDAGDSATAGGQGDAGSEAAKNAAPAAVNEQASEAAKSQPEPKVDPKPEVNPEPEPARVVREEPTPKPEPKPEPAPKKVEKPEPNPEPAPKKVEKPEPKPEPKPAVKEEPKEDAKVAEKSAPAADEPAKPSGGIESQLQKELDALKGK
jgi:hypothetical protein